MLSRIHAPRRHTPSCPFFGQTASFTSRPPRRTPKAASRSPFSARSDCRCSVEPMVTSFIVKIRSPAFMPPFFAGETVPSFSESPTTSTPSAKSFTPIALPTGTSSCVSPPGSGALTAPAGTSRAESAKTNAAQAAAPCRLLRFRRLSSIPSPLLFKRKSFPFEIFLPRFCLRPRYFLQKRKK